jgi:hypothetical protein
MSDLHTLEIIDQEITGAATGTISGAQSVSFRMTAGTATILTNQTLDAAGVSVINFDALENGEPLPDIAYSVDAASTMLIVGYRYNEV